MATFQSLFLLWCTIWSFVCAEGSFMIPAHRDYGDRNMVNSVSALRKRQSGAAPNAIGKSLYWFGNWTVAASGLNRLLIDTGSSDLILNTGLYKPSKYAAPYGTGNFTITYEGVNRQGFGFETINGTVKSDYVSAAGLSTNNTAVGAVKSFQYKDAKQLPYANQGQGIIGFGGPHSSSFNPPANSWFFDLCREKLITECKLGLAFGSSGKGLTILGTTAKKLIKGEFTVTKRLKHVFANSYTVFGDVTLDNEVVSQHQALIMDCGTDNLQGPINEVRKIFKKLGYHYVEKSGGPDPFNPNITLKVLEGTFPCDKPPTLGLTFPSHRASRQVFNVPLSVWDVYDHGNNNCTSILGGTNALGSSSVWLIGQPFFASHYVDFDITSEQIAFADLKNPVDPSA